MSSSRWRTVVRPVSEGRLKVYKRGLVWYGECSQCPGEEHRIRSAWLPYTHGKAMRHVAKHKAEVR
jgi:hypothetical protein